MLVRKFYFSKIDHIHKNLCFFLYHLICILFYNF
ncbi:unnamed protein product [Arabidopsis halleri]